jgi:UDP-N-acetylmuramate dehydrogenase
MPPLEEFAEIIRRNAPLAEYTYLKVGGPAEMLILPRNPLELAAVLKRCFRESIPVRVFGSGCNVLVRDEGVRGVVLRLSEPAFRAITLQGKRVRAGTGASVSALISETARNGLAGLEPLIGIPGTVGGALRCNAGDRSGDIGQFVRQVEVLDRSGELQIRERDELQFAYRWSNLDDPVILSADFELEPDESGAIVKRMRKAWILRKASQPLSFQPAGRLFKNPRGLNASALIEQAGLAKTRVGGAEVSERDAAFVVIHQGATARDVLRLIDLVRTRVQEKFTVELELEIAIW